MRRGERDVGSAATLLIALDCILLIACSSGCARLLTRPPRLAGHDAAAIVAAGAARERALAGLRLTLSVRATAGPPAARLASPAYLAIDDPDHLRLQVLSPFGVTVLDLTVRADEYELVLPLRNERKSGRIDLPALAAGTTPEDERMIVALALLFRPKMDRERCRTAGPTAVTCTVTADLAAMVTVDDALRPIREAYVGADGQPLLSAVLEEYASRGDVLPGRITISDGQGGPALVIRVVKAQKR